MSNVIQPFHLLVIALVGWFSRHQQDVIDYLIEENRVLKMQLEGRRLRFTDEQRIRLAVKAKAVGLRQHGAGQRATVHADVVDSEAPDPRWAGELAKLKQLLDNQKAAV